MAAPYAENNNYNNNGYNQYQGDQVNRAPSPYHQDRINRAPSPYREPQQASNNSYYQQHPQQYDNGTPMGHVSPYSEGPTPASEEGERGLMGAIGGAATGGYIGHKTCHTFLGSVGGALIGSLTEDWAKKTKPLCHNKPPAPSTQCAPPPQPNCALPAPVYYSPPIIDSHTTMHNTTHVIPGGTYGGQSPPVYSGGNGYGHHPVKPCGHQGHCGCQFFHKN